MNNKITVIGSYISPYVRKVLSVLELKQIPYFVDPIIPFYGNDEFTQLNPARRIPILIDGDNVIADSTVIIEYLDEKYPDTSVFPHAVEQRAHARWLEEYADTVMGEVFIWRYFNQTTINRFVWKNEPDKEALKRIIDEDIPHILDYLESILPSSGTLFDDLSIADISISAFFKNLFFARYQLDKSKWPLTSSFVDRVLGMPCLAKLQKYEELSVRSPINQHRQLLIDAGAPIAENSYGTANPRKGILSL